MLAFNEPIEPAFSSVKLINEEGKAIPTKKPVVDPVDKKVLRTAIPVLINGTYTVRYSTMGRDGLKQECPLLTVHLTDDQARELVQEDLVSSIG